MLLKNVLGDEGAVQHFSSGSAIRRVGERGRRSLNAIKLDGELILGR